VPLDPAGGSAPDPHYRLALRRSPYPGLKPPKHDTLASPLLPVGDPGPHLIHGSFDPPEAAPKWHIDRLSRSAGDLIPFYLINALT